MLATKDGWLGTLRSIRWSPMLVMPVVSCAALGILRSLADPDPGRMAVVAEAALALAACASAFIVDDPTLESAPAMPTDARARFAARAVVMAPVIILGWLAVLGVYRWSASPAAAADAGIALTGLGLGSTALALAALSGRSPAVPYPGAAGIGFIIALGALAQLAPIGWLKALPPSDVAWPVAIVLAVLTVRVALREPRP